MKIDRFLTIVLVLEAWNISFLVVTAKFRHKMIICLPFLSKID